MVSCHYHFHNRPTCLRKRRNTAPLPSATRLLPHTAPAAPATLLHVGCVPKKWGRKKNMVNLNHNHPNLPGRGAYFFPKWGLSLERVDVGIRENNHIIPHPLRISDGQPEFSLKMKGNENHKMCQGPTALCLRRHLEGGLLRCNLSTSVFCLGGFWWFPWPWAYPQDGWFFSGNIPATNG